MQRVKRTKQGPDALLNLLESPQWAQSSWACDVARAPKLSVLVGLPTPAEALVQGTYSRILWEEAKMNRASQCPSQEEVPGPLVRAFLY